MGGSLKNSFSLKIFNIARNLRPFNPPRGVLGPFGPKVGNGVENEFPGSSGPRVQTVKNGVEKELDPGAGRPRELIFYSVSNFGPEGPKNSSGGIEGSQSRNRKQNRNRRNRFPGTETGTGTVLSFKNVLKHRKTLSREEPPEPKSGTDRTFPPPNRNRTEPNRGRYCEISMTTFEPFFGPSGII